MPRWLSLPPLVLLAFLLVLPVVSLGGAWFSFDAVALDVLRAIARAKMRDFPCRGIESADAHRGADPVVAFRVLDDGAHRIGATVLETQRTGSIILCPAHTGAVAHPEPALAVGTTIVQPVPCRLCAELRYLKGRHQTRIRIKPTNAATHSQQQ